MTNPTGNIPEIELKFSGKADQQLVELTNRLVLFGKLLDSELKKLDKVDAGIAKKLRRAGTVLKAADGGARLTTQFNQAGNIANESGLYVKATTENQQARMRKSFADSIRSQLFNDIYTKPLATLNKATKGFLEEMVKSGEGKLAKDALLARRAQEAFKGSSSRVLSSLDKQIQYLNDFDAGLKQKAKDLKEANAEAKRKTREAAADAKRVAKEAEREAKRVTDQAAKKAEREATVRYQLSTMQDNAYAPYLSHPKLRRSLEANSRARAAGASIGGSRQRDVEALLARDSKSLTGASRTSYYREGQRFQRQADVQVALSNLSLHQEALRQAVPRTAQGSPIRKELENTLRELELEKKQLNAVLAAFTRSVNAEDLTIKELNKLLADRKRGAKERSYSDSLKSLQSFDPKGFLNLSEADKGVIKKQLKDVKRWLDQAAREELEAGNTQKSLALSRQWVMLDQKSTAIRNSEQAKREAAAEAKRAAKEAEREAKRVAKEAERDAKRAADQAARKAEREATVRYQLSAIQDNAYAPYLNHPKLRPLLEANARARATRTAMSGSRQRDVEALLAGDSKNLVGASRIRYYQDGQKFKNQGDVQIALSGLSLHREALSQALPRTAQGSPMRKELENTLHNLAIEEQQLRAVLASFRRVMTSQDATVNEMNKLMADRKRGAKEKSYATSLRDLHLFDPKNFAALSDAEKGMIKKQFKEVKRWLEQAAREELEAGNAGKALSLSRQWVMLDQKSTAIRNSEQGKAAAEKRKLREDTRYEEVKNRQYRDTSIESQIKGMKDLATLKVKQTELTGEMRRATELFYAAQKKGDVEEIARAEQLLKLYAQEKLALMERQKMLQPRKGTAERFAELNTPQGRAGLFATQGLLRENYAIQNVLTGSISGGYNFIKDFEAALKQTQAISQASTVQVDRLKNSIIEVSDASRFSAIQLAEASTVLAQAGFSIGEVEKSLSAVATLATATGSSLEDSVDIATSVLGAFQLSASSMPDIVNQITQAMNLSKLDVPKFKLALQYAGNTAAEMGMSFRETLADIATIANTGIRSGSTMGTGMRQILADLAAPSAKFKAILKELGLTLTDVDVRVFGLSGVLKNLKEKGFSAADALEAFQLRAANIFTALGNNLDTYDQLYVALDDNTAAMRAQEIQMDSLAAQSDRMNNQFKILADTVGGETASAITDLFRGIANMTSQLNTLMEDSVAGSVVKFGLLTFTIAGLSFAIVRTIQMLAGLSLVMRAARIQSEAIIAAKAAETAATVGATAASATYTAVKTTETGVIAGASVYTKAYTAARLAETAATTRASVVTNSYTASLIANTAAMFRNIAAGRILTAVSMFTRAHPLLVFLTLGATLATAFTLASNQLGTTIAQNKKTLDEQIGVYKELEDSIKTYESSVSEIDNKLSSLNSRSESLRKNQGELAVEFSEVRKKALELGVSLSTQVENTVDSLRMAWEELRKEMTKKIIVDVSLKSQALDQQQASARNLYNLTTEKQGYTGGKALFRNSAMQTRGMMATTRPLVEKYFNSELPALGKGEVRVKDGDAYLAVGNANRLVAGYAQKLGFTPEQSEGLIASMLKTQRYLTADVERLNPKQIETVNKELQQSFEEVNALLLELNKRLMRASTDKNYSEWHRKRFRMAKKELEENFLRKAPMEEDPDAPESLAMRYAAFQAIVSQSKATKLVNSEAARAGAAQMRQNKEGVFSSGFLMSKAQPLTVAQVNALSKSRDRWFPLVEKIAAEQGLDPNLLMALLQTESGGNPDVTSEAGAAGLIQLMPKTAAAYGVSSQERFNPEKNIRAAAKYLKDLERDPSTQGQISRMLMAYNYGQGNLQKASQGKGTIEELFASVPKETQDHLIQTASNYAALSAQNIPRGGATVLKAAAYDTEDYRRINKEIGELAISKSSISRRLKLAQEAQDENQTMVLTQILAEAEAHSQRLQEDRNQILAAAKEQVNTEREKLEVEAEISKLQKEALVQGKTADLNRIDPAKDFEAYKKALTELIETKKLAALEGLNLEKLKAGESDITTDALILKAQKEKLITAKSQLELARIKREGDDMLHAARKKYEEEQLRILLEGIKNRTDALKKEHDEALGLIEERTRLTQALIAKETNSRNLFVDVLRQSRSNMDNPLRKFEYNSGDIEALDKTIGRISAANEDYNERFDLNETLKNNQASSEALKQLESDRLIESINTEEKMAEVLIKAKGNADDKVYQALKDRLDALKDQLRVYSGKLTELKTQEDTLNRKLQVLNTGDLADEYRNLSNKGEKTQDKKSAAERRLKLFEDLAATWAKSDPESKVAKFFQSKAESYRREIEQYEEELSAFANRKSQIEAELAKNFSADKVAALLTGRKGIGERLASHYRQQAADRLSDDGTFQDALTITDSLKEGFEGLTSSLMKSTDSVEDFFRAIIGRSREGKDAWRQFGLGIIESALKVVTNRMVEQMMELMLGTEDPKTGKQTSQGWLQMGMSALKSMFSAGGSDKTSATKMATGGKVTGGTPNKDSVPIMAMPNEWVLPTSTTKVLGDQFMEGLRTNPAATMAKVTGVGAMMGGSRGSSETNVYVVSPDKTPTGLTSKDVIVTISQDLANNGPIHQMIKQIKQ